MKTVLVVDDELELLAAIGAILEDEGYRVETCSDGKQALERLTRGAPPDLVITDVMMPRLSGYELLSFIRRDRALRKIPVIVMSAVNPSAKHTDGRWDAFLHKPFDLDDLIATAAALVGRAPARHASSAQSR